MPRKNLTPVTDPGILTIVFAGCRIAEFGRVDPSAGWIKFHCSLGNGLEALFKRMGWAIPGEKTALEKLDGKLEGGHFILTPKVDPEKLAARSPNGNVDTAQEVNLEFQSISKFECHRFELEGRKKKGFRRELRFAAQFKCEDGCANLESYMIRTDNARGSLKVVYLKEAVQDEIPLDDDKQGSLIPDGVHPTAEQRQGAMEN